MNMGLNVILAQIPAVLGLVMIIGALIEGIRHTRKLEAARERTKELLK